MRVSSFYDGAITDIDVLRYPTQIGHEVFSTGKISFDSLKEMISVLRGYAQVMLEYGVTQYIRWWPPLFCGGQKPCLRSGSD